MIKTASIKTCFLYSILIMITCNCFVILPINNLTKLKYFKLNKVYLNRIFFEDNEITSIEASENIIVSINRNDYRYDHITKILKMKVGDKIRCGIVDKGMQNNSILTAINKDNITIDLGKMDSLITNVDEPKVDLILAVPRPLRLEKILPVISCIGVSNLLLIGANKVQADYFGSHLLRNPNALRKCLIEGLSQCEVDYKLPKVHIQRNFNNLLNDDIDRLFPNSSTLRLIAHPILPVLDSMDKFEDITTSRLFSSINRNYLNNKNIKRVVVVIGAEGGWEEYEIKALVEKDFKLINVGNRILRTDMAVPVLLGLAHEWIELNGNNDITQ